MKRRDFLTTVGLTAGACFNFPAPAVAQNIRRLTMVTDYPEGPGMFASAKRLARTIAGCSGGRIQIDVSASGAVVRPLETFDAVAAGVADMFHSHIGYFEKKSPAFHFFSGVPFGLTAGELFAWVHFGGGQELWDELSGAFGVKPILSCSTGAQMGGWFVREVDSVEALRGLRYRMAGPGAEVYRRLGAVVVMVPGDEIVQSLQSGAIDACEWIGPWLDTVMGLHKAAGYYYQPGWHEPGTGLALGIGSRVWESLNDADRSLIEAAAAGEYAVSLAEFNTNNALALRRLRGDRAIDIRKFDDALVRTFAELSKEIVFDLGSGDELAKRIYASYMDFLTLLRDWSDIAERQQ